MEKKIYTDGFERLLKEKSDEFRMYPSKRVWHSIYNDLHPGRKWPSIAMSMILVISLLLIGSLNTNDNSVKTSVANTSDAQNALSKKTIASANRLQQHDSKGHPQNDLATNDNPSSENDGNVIPGSGNISGNTINANATDAVSGNEGTALANSNDPARFLNDKNAPQNAAGRNNTVASMNYYIKSNQLFSDIDELNKVNGDKNTTNSNTPSLSMKVNAPRDENITAINAANLQNNSTAILTSAAKIQDENKAVTADENPTTKTSPAVQNKSLYPNEQKAWMEDYALHNKSQRKKWKDRVAMELYVTPSLGYRNLSDNIKNPAAAQSYAASGNSNNRTVSQKPSLNLEAGFDLAYSIKKNLRVKTGVQLNYTSYGVNADQINHPIGTTLLLNDPNTGLPYLTSRTSTLANSSGLQSVTVKNTTYQVSVPVGIAVKLAGNNKVEWHAGASIQPSFVFGGLTNFISSDYSSYVSDASLLRKWNMNAGVETYLNYKMNGFNLQVGPQFRYQLFSTYTKQYTLNENLYNVGIKVGLVKNF